jgi:hypothetical protein
MEAGRSKRGKKNRSLYFATLHARRCPWPPRCIERRWPVKDVCGFVLSVAQQGLRASASPVNDSKSSLSTSATALSVPQPPSQSSRPSTISHRESAFNDDES